MNTTVSRKKDLYAQVTDSIIATMEAGRTSQIAWTRTGTAYTACQGVNVLLLWAAAMKNSYASERWMAYKQTTEMGGQVRKGEKSVECIFFGTVERESKKKKEDNETTETVRVIRPFWLFNLDQIDGRIIFFLSFTPAQAVGEESGHRRARMRASARLKHGA